MRTDNAVSKPLPAGAYIVGDPCYAFPDQGDWMALLESGGLNDPDGMPRIMECDLPERRLSFTASGTSYGDGTYTDQFGNQYAVDAGLIGVVPAFAPGVEADSELVQIVEFDEPFTVEYDEGVITIGRLIINTGEEELDEEDMLGDYDEDEDEE